MATGVLTAMKEVAVELEARLRVEKELQKESQGLIEEMKALAQALDDEKAKGGALEDPEPYATP